MRTYLAVGFAAALTACAGSDSTRTSGMDATAYRSTALQLSSAATSYDTATSTMTTPAECTDALQQHLSQLQPVAQQMGQLAGPMDGAMESMGRMTDADMECGFTVMQQQLRQYAAGACSASDMAANREAARQHVATLQALSNHMQMRADEVSQLAAGTTPGGLQAGMMQGSGPTGTTGTWTMPGGGTMSWGDAMPGCQLVNGTFQPGASGGVTNG